MTPDERDRLDRIKKEMEQKLDAIMRKSKLMEKGTPIQQEHLAEQMDAFIEDVKTGKAFEGEAWKITYADRADWATERDLRAEVLKKLDQLAWKERMKKRVIRCTLWFVAGLWTGGAIVGTWFLIRWLTNIR